MRFVNVLLQWRILLLIHIYKARLNPPGALLPRRAAPPFDLEETSLDRVRRDTALIDSCVAKEFLKGNVLLLQQIYLYAVALWLVRDHAGPAFCLISNHIQ